MVEHQIRLVTPVAGHSVVNQTFPPHKSTPELQNQRFFLSFAVLVLERWPRVVVSLPCCIVKWRFSIFRGSLDSRCHRLLIPITPFLSDVVTSPLKVVFCEILVLSSSKLEFLPLCNPWSASSLVPTLSGQKKHIFYVASYSVFCCFGQLDGRCCCILRHCFHRLFSLRWCFRWIQWMIHCHQVLRRVVAW